MTAEPTTNRRNTGARLPYVVVNMAITADGKIATRNRAVSSFGSSHDRQHLLQLRATADAVMAGARTVDLNKINLGPGPAVYRRLRLRRGLAEYNLRVIVSRTGTVNPKAEVFKRRFSPIIILTAHNVGRRRLKQLSLVANEIKISGKDQINFRAALAWLRKKWHVRRLICEGGGELNDALFRANLVDELHLTVCPVIFGGRAAPTIADGAGAGLLSRAAELECQSARRKGDEMFFVFHRCKERIA
jgi:riboflavin-specific deaminase-like protein